MGVVYFCFDTSTGIPVVAKSLPQEKLADPKIRTRFLDECNLWISVGRHPSIATALFVETLHSIPYVFIEWIVGPMNCFDSSAAHLIRRQGALPLDLALSLGIDVCDGMIFLADHFASKGHRFVHSDLKPANILIDSRWTGKVTDFGLSFATEITEASSPELHGAAVQSVARVSPVGAGTAAYMAPERFLAGHQVDERSDVYSFGCTIWEMLTGQRLFEFADKRQWGDAHLTKTPDFAILNPLNLPAGLVDLLKSCLEKSPANRPGAFSQLKDTLLQMSPSLRRDAGDHDLPGQVSQHISDDLQKAILDASSLDAMGKSREALEIFDKVNDQLKAVPSHSPIMRFSLGWNRAIALEHVGEHEQALREWDVLLDLVDREDLTKGHWTPSIEPTRPSVLVEKAKTLGGLGRADEAIPLCRSALEISPGLHKAITTLAILHLQAGHIDECMHWSQKAIEGDSHDATALANMGAALAVRGAQSEALMYLERALAIAPSHGNALYVKGTCLLDLGDYENAVPALERAVVFEPHYSEAWNHLGLAKRGLGDAACRDCFEKALAADPNNLAARINLTETDAHAFLNTLLRLALQGGGVFQIQASIVTGEFLDALRVRIAQFRQVQGQGQEALEHAVQSLDAIRQIAGVTIVECSVVAADRGLAIDFRYALDKPS
ncbi:MAG: protein kinase [Pirellulaceae bacterium]